MAATIDAAAVTLRRIIRHFGKQGWTAITIDFVIVGGGFFPAFSAR
jgi:hypothetical protein